MGMYEKIKKVIDEWQDGEYILSRGYKMDCYPDKEYGIRDKITIDGDKIVYKLWDTEIIEYNKNTKKLILRTGGWNTRTTKEKMNTMLNLLKLPYTVEGRYETRRTEAGPWYLVKGEEKKEFDDNLIYMDLQEKPWDEFDFIMAWEGGEVTDNDVIEGFQHLIDNGHAWTLQGMYGRTAKALIEAGYCHRKGELK